jgi:hypothetical protein
MHQWQWKEEAIQEHDKEKEDNVATEDRVNERFHQSAIVERDGRNYWKVLQIYGGHLVGSWTLHTAIGGVMARWEPDVRPGDWSYIHLQEKR